MCFLTIKKLFSLRKSQNAQTSSFVFKLVTKYTVYMLLLFILLTGWKQIFGQSTTCLTSSGEVRNDVMEYKCWIKGVFNSYSNPQFYWDGYEWELKKYDISNPNYQGEKYLKIGFYGWILPLLIAHALCLAIPLIHWYYKQEETIPKSLKKLPTPDITDDWIIQRIHLIEYFKKVEKSHHRLFAVKYLFCEFITIILNLLIMLFMSVVIDDFWEEYRFAAASLLKFDFKQFYHYSSEIFPKEARCNFYVYNLNKYTEHKNTTCTFPHNEFYAKIFAILYIWYIFIMTWAVIHFIILVALYIFKCLRIKHIRYMLGRPATSNECNCLTVDGDHGLWFTLYIFRRNMHLSHFQDLCTGLLTETVCQSDP